MFNSHDYTKYIDMAVNYVSEYSFKVFGALAIFIIGRWAAHKITAVSKKLMIKSKLDKTLVEFSESIVYFILLLAVIMAALNTLGVATTSIVAVFGAVGLAVGLALKDSLSNIGAAVLIMMFRPFKIGDVIDAGGAHGTVEDINLFSTTISPVDNRTIIVPNSRIIAANITNFSKKEQRRIDHIIGIGYDADLKLAKSVLLEILGNNERILKEPAPFVGVSELGESSVNFTVRAWVKTDDFGEVNFALLEEIKLTFDEKGITIPYPQMDIHINND
ncbi:mechanosensitive ion channel domain-containing protein [Sulfurimonas sp. HSL-1716]|uniref:mechanosensitive ion channel family protein n=1 Tax=Hydrocurvibacter sulfurireducens TaxID=3131937 RepID=UPI0031F929C1